MIFALSLSSGYLFQLGRFRKPKLLDPASPFLFWMYIRAVFKPINWGRNGILLPGFLLKLVSLCLLRIICPDSHRGRTFFSRCCQTLIVGGPCQCFFLSFIPRFSQNVPPLSSSSKTITLLGSIIYSSKFQLKSISL